MTVHYLLDSNAVLQTPEVLAAARHCKLLIPKAVLAKLATRGREHIRKVVGALINDAIEAGAEVIEAPPHIEREPVASDLSAHQPATRRRWKLPVRPSGSPRAASRFVS